MYCHGPMRGLIIYGQIIIVVISLRWGFLRFIDTTSQCIFCANSSESIKTIIAMIFHVTDNLTLDKAVNSIMLQNKIFILVILKHNV